MKIGKVVGHLTSSWKLEEFESRKLLLVKPVSPDGEFTGRATMAIDYVGAGPGDRVLYGAAPGLAASVFSLERAPINELIMAIVDDIHQDQQRDTSHEKGE